MNHQSEQINELMGALAKAQGEFTHASKDTANPYFKSKYADLASVWQACREPLSKNGLAVTQTMDLACDGTRQILITMLSHASGQWIKSIMMIPVQKPGPQELGSCLSYCRRYALAALVGVYQDDDDAESAQKPYRAENGGTPAVQNKAKQGLSADQRAKLDFLIAKINDPDYIDQLEGYVENTLGVLSLYEISNGDYVKIVKSLEKKIENSKGAANGSEGVVGVA